MTIEKRILSIFLALVIAVSLFPAFGVEAWAEIQTSIKYIKPIYVDDNDVTKGISGTTEESVSMYTEITNGTTLLSLNGNGENGGWYVVTGDNVQINSTVTVTGDVHLILADGCSISAIAANDTSKAGINVPSGSSLTIYGQTEGTGQLTATGKFDNYYNYYGGAGIGGNANQPSGRITINGGTVIASSGSNAAGIGGGRGSTGSGITINGGNVTATGNNGGSGIGGGNNGGVGSNITINGGTVTATGGIYFAAGIGNGKNCTTSASSIKINKNLILKAGDASSSAIFLHEAEEADGTIDVEETLDGKKFAVVAKPNYLTFTAEEANSTVKLNKSNGKELNSIQK